MTLRERLRIFGLGLRGEQSVKEVVKEVHEKSILGGFLDFSKKGLSGETRVSDKLLGANTGWVYRNNDVLAKEVAQTEFELYTVKFVAGEIVYDRVTQHPILDLLDRFNEFTTKADGLYLTESHQNLAGDAFWLLDGKGFNVKNIFLLQPDKVELVLGDQIGGQRIIQAYQFKDTVSGKAVEQTYDAEDIIHFKQPNPKNPYRGLSKVEALADDIDTDNLAINASRSLFERGMITNFALSTEQKLTSDQRRDLQADLRATSTGPANSFKVPIFSGGLKPEVLQATNRDTQFIDLEVWLRDKITSAFGNNKAVIGLTDDVNRANAEETIAQWRRTTVNYEIRSIVDVINEFLVPRYGTNLLLGYKDVVEDDESEIIEKATTLKNSDLITLNEAREMLDLDPVKNGDEFGFERTERRMDQIQVPVVPKSVQNVSYEKALRRMGIYQQVKDFKEYKQAAKPIAEKIIKGRRKPRKPYPPAKKFVNFSDETAWEYYEKQLGIIQTHEQIFQNKVEQYVQKLVDKALSAVPEEVSEMQRKQLFDEDEEIRQAQEQFVPILVAVAVAARHLALDLINYDKPLIDTAIESKVRERVEWFAKSMLDTDKEKFIDLIAQGVADGLPIPDIRNNITETFSTYTKAQAERVARTEVAHASVQASLDAWKESGVVQGYEWIVAQPEDTCMEYAGMVRDDEDDFPEGPPPIHPNCKCGLIPVVKSKEGKIAYFKEKAYEAQVAELEAKIDKRTKKYKDLQKEKLEVEEYAKELEGLLGAT